MKLKTATLSVLVIALPFAPISAQKHEHVIPRDPVVTTTTVPGPATLANTSHAANTVEVTITAQPTLLSFVPGGKTASYAYNGRVPGPTLDVREGDHVIIHFLNKLPEATTIHWHGMHIPATSDGSPFNMIAPGKSYVYEFTVEKGTAGTYWYHPHPNHSTGGQIARGLFGAMIVRAINDPLPKSIADKLLVLSDNRFRPDGSLDMPDPSTPQGNVDLSNGREGNILYVNGEVMPTITIKSGEVQRWRIVNASASRVYRLAIPGQTMLHIGSDGGLFDHPVEVKDILVANSERVEVLVRGTGAPGSTTVLQTLPYDRYVQQTRPPAWDKPLDLLTLQYTNDAPVTPIAIPAVLRHVAPIDTSRSKHTRLFVLQQGFINGRLHDMSRVDETAKLGDVEIWQIENLVGMDHPFHLHGFQFQVIDRNGVPEPFRSWKDTVNIPKHSTVRFIVHLSEFPGKWMYHCHILDHEDHGMMGVLEVK